MVLEQWKYYCVSFEFQALTPSTNLQRSILCANTLRKNNLKNQGGVITPDSYK